MIIDFIDPNSLSNSFKSSSFASIKLKNILLYFWIIPCIFLKRAAFVSFVLWILAKLTLSFSENFSFSVLKRLFIDLLNAANVTESRSSAVAPDWVLIAIVAFKALGIWVSYPNSLTMVSLLWTLNLNNSSKLSDFKSLDERGRSITWTILVNSGSILKTKLCIGHCSLILSHNFFKKSPKLASWLPLKVDSKTSLTIFNETKIPPILLSAISFFISKFLKSDLPEEVSEFHAVGSNAHAAVLYREATYIPIFIPSDIVMSSFEK